MGSWCSGLSHKQPSSTSRSPPPTTTATSQSAALSESEPAVTAADNRAAAGKSDQSPPVGTYFFHGPLQDADTLRNVLQLAEEPVLKPAFVKGFVLKRWSMYPVMLWSKPESTVRGHVYIVHSTEDAEKLVSYARRALGFPKPCRIFVDGGSDAIEVGVEGYTFLFRGGSRNQQDLVDWRNGSFDLDTDLETLKRWEAARAGSGQTL